MKRRSKKEQSNKLGQQFTGVLEITRSAAGFVAVEGLEKDIIIKPGNYGTALDGDTVTVRVLNDSGNKEKRKEGEIIAVVSRKQTEFIGTLQMGTNFAFCIVDTDKPMPDIYLPLDSLNNAVNGDKVIVALTQWEKPRKSPNGKVIMVLDKSSQADVAMKSLLLENGFSIAFSEEVMDELSKMPETIDAKEIKKRRDMRSTLTFTIDPVDAKDFDDAISIKKLKNGNYEVGVHIADVSHYVVPGTALDDVAYQKATSVYLPDRVSPMLPEKISNELCSLRPNEDKLTFSTVFEITENGKIVNEWIGRTAIHSNKRFTYEEVQAIIEGADSELKQEILLFNKWAQMYRAERFKKGAINFSSQEVKFKLDETGKPIGIVIKESKESHQLVEEFMLLANRTVATYVANYQHKDGEIPFAYRVHDTPNEEKLTMFVEFAKRYGHKFNTTDPQKIATSFNTMLAAAKGRPEQHVLETLGIRTMAKAAYTTHNIGHYGLGFENYCHFTSPIRRYPDIMVHRVLQQCLDGKVKFDKKTEEKCKHCSEREKAAMDTERSANKYKQVEYMQDKVGEIFEAVISGVAHFGFWAETVEHKCEGLVSITQLQDFGDFMYSEADYSLSSKHGNLKFAIGDKVKIQVVAASLEKRQLDFEWINDKGAKKYQTSHRKKRNPNKAKAAKAKNKSAKKRR